MSNNKASMEKGNKKLNLIIVIMVLIGAVILTCLLFFFSRTFPDRNSAIPQIYSAEQIGCTDSSVLISWSCSESAKDFSVLFREADKKEYSEIKTSQPFAALHDLKPYCRYDVRIVPVDGEKDYEPISLECSTAPYCHITSVEAVKVNSDSVSVRWQYEGLDEGFSVVAYAVDGEGKRHVTSDIIKIPAGSEKQCNMTGLLSNVHYTVCVMPESKYMTVGKTTFTTLKYSEKNNRVNIIRFVICPYQSANSFMVTQLKALTPNDPYKTSILYNGEASPEEKVDLMIYITDENGTFVSDFTQRNVQLNPDDVTSYVFRSWMSDFTAPARPGNYLIYAAVDGVTVTRTNFHIS